MSEISRDYYANCEGGCTHDLARGVLTAELLGGDDPTYKQPLTPIIPAGHEWLAQAVRLIQPPSTAPPGAR